MNYIQRSKEIFAEEIEELNRVKDNIGSNIESVINVIYNSKGKVVVTGIGKTGLIGQKIAASLSSTGTQAVFMNATDAMHGDLGVLSPKDVVIAISNSGSTFEITNIIAPIKRIGAVLVAMTGNLNSPLAQEADYSLNVSVQKEAGVLNLAPTTSTTAALMMGDAITVCLMEKRKFKAEDFAIYHPGGALGRRLLTKVRDLASKDFPVVNVFDSFKEVIFTISDRRKGMTMVSENGVLVGIITDGDIRRAMQNIPDVMNAKARDVMTRGFKRISEDLKIEAALDLMQRNKITSLAVYSDHDRDDVIGLITIHDIIDFNK